MKLFKMRIVCSSAESPTESGTKLTDGPAWLFLSVFPPFGALHSEEESRPAAAGVARQRKERLRGVSFRLKCIHFLSKTRRFAINVSMHKARHLIGAEAGTHDVTLWTQHRQASASSRRGQDHVGGRRDDYGMLQSEFETCEISRDI